MVKDEDRVKENPCLSKDGFPFGIYDCEMPQCDKRHTLGELPNWSNNTYGDFYTEMTVCLFHYMENAKQYQVSFEEAREQLADLRPWLLEEFDTYEDMYW